MSVCVHVPLGDRAYDIQIGQGLLGKSAQYIRPFLRRSKVVIVTDSIVERLHLSSLEEALNKSGIAHSTLTLPAGENTKSWPFLSQTIDFFLNENVERSDVVIALGGGVIGDLVGFAAAILRRGVRFIQIPTSLLAQVDSSVGGKTGINTQQGKNLVGAFHQPILVLADIDVLNTLTRRNFIAGYGEVVKYGLLGDESFFTWLEKNGPSLAKGDIFARIEAVRISCQMKADIIVRDETEQGERALLNLGHTFCHALEAAAGYSDKLLHGEGVAIGCALAFETSARLGLCSQEDPSRLRAHFRAMGMKTDICDIDGEMPNATELLALMGQDKKVVGGQLNYIMVSGIGQSFMTSDVPTEIVLSVLHDAKNSGARSLPRQR
jgi:3-dehydroquinate synthase